MSRNLSWFKNGIQYDAKFTGFKFYPKLNARQRCWNRITVIVYDGDRIDAIREVEKVAGYFGYQDVTIDHIVRVE